MYQMIIFLEATKRPFKSVMTGLAPNGYVLMLWKSRCENMMGVHRASACTPTELTEFLLTLFSCLSGIISHMAWQNKGRDCKITQA